MSLFSSLEITFEDTFSILECLDLTSGKNDIFFILLNGQIDGDYKNMLLHSNFGNNYQTLFLSILLCFLWHYHSFTFWLWVNLLVIQRITLTPVAMSGKKNWNCLQKLLTNEKLLAKTACKNCLLILLDIRFSLSMNFLKSCWKSYLDK